MDHAYLGAQPRRLQVLDELLHDIVGELLRGNPVDPAIAGEAGQAIPPAGVIDQTDQRLPGRNIRFPVAPGHEGQAGLLQGDADQAPDIPPPELAQAHRRGEDLVDEIPQVKRIGG